MIDDGDTERQPDDDLGEEGIGTGAESFAPGSVGGSATASQIRGSSLLLAGQTFAVVVNLVSQILVVRYLSQDAYGAFAYALSVGMITEVVAAFGMRRGVARFMPIYHEHGDLQRAAGVFVLALSTVLSCGTAVILIVAAFRGIIVGSFDDTASATAVLVLLTGLSVAGALGTLLDGVFAVFSRARAIALRRFVAAPLFRLVAVLLIVAQGENVVVLAAAYLVAGLLGLGMYGPLLPPILREHGIARHLRPGRFVIPARTVFRFTVPLLASDLTSVALISSGAIVLGLLAAPADVAEFRAVLPLATTMSYILSSFGLLLVPIAARLYARSAADELNEVYWRTAAWTAALAFPIFLTCVVLASPLVTLLFGGAYSSAAGVLAVLALGVFIDTSAGHNELLLGVFGRVRLIVIANVVAIAVNVVLVIVLAPRYGAVGAAIATSAALISLNAIRQIGLARETDIHGMVPSVVPLYGVMIAVSAFGVAVQAFLSPPTAVGILIVLASFAAVAYVAHSRLALAEMFPELERIPVIRRIVGASRREPGT